MKKLLVAFSVGAFLGISALMLTPATASATAPLPPNNVERPCNPDTGCHGELCWTCTPVRNKSCWMGGYATDCASGRNGDGCELWGLCFF